MSLGTKNRLQQTADQCKEHLRDKHADKLVLVEEFVQELEGSGKERDVARWSQFADLKGIKADTLERLDAQFEKWLNPG